MLMISVAGIVLLLCFCCTCNIVADDSYIIFGFDVDANLVAFLVAAIVVAQNG